MSDAETSRLSTKMERLVKSRGEPDQRLSAAQSLRLANVDLEDDLDCDVILEALGRSRGYCIPEIDAVSIVDNLLPPLKGGINVEEVISLLELEGVIRGACQRWMNFDSNPVNVSEKQEEIYPSLVGIFKRATEFAMASVPELRQTFELVLLPKLPRKSRHSGMPLPERCMILREVGCSERETKRESDSHSWLDAAFTVRFRIEETDEDRDINTSRLVLDMQRIMEWNAGRRFTFGITVENTTMRLWFCSRAIMVASNAFNFLIETHLLTRAFLSLAFASKEDLGWDPTIRPILRDSVLQAYHIDVGGQTYETKGVLSDPVDGALISHATRVWKVKLLGSDEEYVLKDIWLDDDRDLEHATYGAMLHDVEEMYGGGVRSEVATHLVTPVAHWLVPVNGEEDHTTNVMMRGYEPSSKDRFEFKVQQVTADDDDMLSLGYDKIPSGSELGPPFRRGTRLRKLPHRRHYRVVFKEIAKPLHAVTSLSDVFVILRDCAKVLKWIHGCGWVHRDISAGNLYLYEGRGLIADLEYAKRRNHDVSHELRTGTPDFMSVEASKRDYLYRPEEKFDIRGDLLLLLQKIEKRREEPTSIVTFPFFHNDLHDLESLWWAAIWVLFTRDYSRAERNEKELAKVEEDRKAAAWGLFSRTGSMSGRMCFFQYANIYYHKVAWMPDSLFDIPAILDILRKLLLLSYRKFEAKFPEIRTDTFGGIQDKMAEIFDICRERVQLSESSPLRVNASNTHQRGIDSDEGRTALDLTRRDRKPDIGSGRVDAAVACSVLDPKATVPTPPKPRETITSTCLPRKRKLDDCDFSAPEARKGMEPNVESRPVNAAVACTALDPEPMASTPSKPNESATTTCLPRKRKLDD